MTNIETDALWRAGYLRAKIWRVAKRTCGSAAVAARWLWQDPRQSLPDLTDRQARDIGLDGADLEWRRLKLPSRTTRHPML